MNGAICIFLIMYLVLGIITYISCKVDYWPYTNVNVKQKLFVSFFCGPIPLIVEILTQIYDWLGNNDTV